MTQGALTAFDPRPEWSWEPLGYLAPRVAEDGHGDLEPLSVYLGAGVVRRADREDNHNVLGADTDKYLRVLPGDLVFNKLRTWQGGLGASRYEGIVSPAYYVLRPGPRLEPRFAHYVLVSTPYLAELTRLSKFMPPSQFDMPWDALKRLPIALPPVEEQRRIADFLDDQVTRIDAAIQVGDSQLGELGALAGQRFLAELAEGQEALNWPCVRLGHLLRQFTNGYVGPTRDLLVEEGVPYVQSLHIKNGQIDFDRRPYFVPQEWHDERPRIHLRQGDVLIVQTGDIGSIAVVPEGFMEASCHALIIARPRAELISSEYLGEFLRSPLGQSELISRATGALHPHLESGIKDAVIVVPPLADQDRITRTMKAVRADVRATTSAGIQRRRLLEERKRALITAAVTGEFDVTTAKPIGMGKWVPNVGAGVEAPALVGASSIGGMG